jgi:pilin isopeptide linkage protein
MNFLKHFKWRAAALSMALLLLVGAVSFRAYAAESVPVILKVEVALTGEEPEEDESFTIILEADDPDAPLPKPNTVTIDGEGEAVFNSITFSAPGRYNYTLRQHNNGSDGYTYDDTVYKVTVNVRSVNDGATYASANGGALYASVSGYKEGKEEGKISTFGFINEYQEPTPDSKNPEETESKETESKETESEEPESKETESKEPESKEPSVTVNPTTPSGTNKTSGQTSSPKTGDNTNLNLLVGLMLISGITIASGMVWVLRRKH